MQVIVYKVTRAGFVELHRFKIDPTKKSYVHLEKSELGFEFVPDDDDELRAALEARGLEIRSKNDD